MVPEALTRNLNASECRVLICVSASHTHTHKHSQSKLSLNTQTQSKHRRLTRSSVILKIAHKQRHILKRERESVCSHKGAKLLIMNMPLTNQMAVSELRSHALLIVLHCKNIAFRQMFYNNRFWRARVHCVQGESF